VLGGWAIPDRGQRRTKWEHLTLRAAAMLGFKLDLWDYLTFVVIFLGVVAFLVALVFVLGLPGRIAIARRHPDAEAVKLMGFAGFLAVIPWIQALIWAFKPTNAIDIRYFPKQEQEQIAKNIAKLKEEEAPKKKQGPQEVKPDIKEAG
jgi:uncharacterized membrane protein